MIKLGDYLPIYLEKFLNQRRKKLSIEKFTLS
jgi:hypothetical protein